MVSGCRRGELCALRWTDLDLDRGVVTIERSADQTSEGVLEKATKTGQKRRLALDSYTVELLTAYRELCNDQCKSLGIALARSAFVFSTSPDFSTPRRPDSITQRYRRLAERNNLRSTRLHALRHYSATELLTAGIDVRTVAGRLGHGSGGATTLRFYAAWVTEADKKAANAIADVIPRPNPLLRTPRSPYELLAHQLRTAIERGDYPPGSALPTTTELTKEHNVAAGTVNRAIALLKDAGLVTAGRGQRVTVCGATRGTQTKEAHV